MQHNIVTETEMSPQQAREGRSLKVETEKLSCEVGYLIRNSSLASTTQLGVQGGCWDKKKKKKSFVLEDL